MDGRNLLLTCVGTKRYPGCRAQFLAGSHKQKFCPACAGLDRASSFVFVERRNAIEAQRLAESRQEIEADLDAEGF
jgi:hypothetical protein